MPITAMSTIALSTTAMYGRTDVFFPDTRLCRMPSSQVDEVVFFLLPSSPVPPGHAAVLYFSVPDSSTGAFEQW